MPVAVVTGAAQGIGRAVAETLAAEGYALVLCDLREPTETIAALPPGAEAVAAPGDVSDDAYAATLAETVRDTFGRADVLVNNAGISSIVPAEALEPDVWRRVLDVN